MSSVAFAVLLLGCGFAAFLTAVYAKNYEGGVSLLLSEAILEDNQTLVKQITECGWADVNAEVAYGMTGLMEAAILGRNAIVEGLLDAGAHVNAKSVKTGWTALMYAASNGLVDTVRLLLNRGAEPDFTDPRGNTAFIVAADGVVKEVLNNRSRITKMSLWDAKSSSGLLVSPNRRPAASFTSTRNKPPSIKVELTNPLFSAVIGGHKSLTKSFINARADVNFQDRLGITALMLASYYGYLEIVQMLLKSNAKIDQRNADGWTALFFAASRNQTKVAKALLENGANYRFRSVNGATPLMISAMEGSHGVLEMLISKKAEINAADSNGATATFYAADRLQHEVLRLLAANGANLNAHKVVDGSTPLMFAVQRGDFATSKVLIDLGADVNAKAKDGATALMYAVFAGNRPMVERLVEFYKANIAIKNAYGLTALHFATDDYIRTYLEQRIPPDFYLNTSTSTRRFCQVSVILLFLFIIFL